MGTSKISCSGPLKGSLWLKPSIPGREKPCHFSQLDVVWVLFGLRCYRLGNQAWGLDLTLLRGNPLKYSSSPSAAAWQPSQPSHISSTLHTNHFVVKLFLLSVCGYKTSLHYCSVVYSGWFLCNLVVISDWPWEEVSVASTYSSAICKSVIISLNRFLIPWSLSSPFGTPMIQMFLSFMLP